VYSGKPHKLVELCGGGFLKTGKQVAVSVQRNGHGGMAEALADDLRMHTCLEQQRSVGMPKVVDAYIWQVGLSEKVIPDSFHLLRCQRISISLAKDKAMVFEVWGS